MSRVAEQEARVGAVEYEPEIEVRAGGPEVTVFRLVDPVELEAGLCRVRLEIEGGRLDGLLLVARQTGEAVEKRVGDSEFHEGSPNQTPAVRARFASALQSIE